MSHQTELREDPNDAVVYTSASALGIIAGLRSMTAPAVLSYLARSGCITAHSDRFGIFSKPAVAKVFYGLAAGELIADKLPFMPRRTEAGALAGRLITGAACGAMVCSAMRRSPVVGAIAGTFGAIGATFAGYYVRAEISQGMGVADPLVALLEDGMAVWAGKAICEGLGRADRASAA